MRTARYVDLCFCYIGLLSLVYFVLAVRARWTVYNLVPLLGSLTFFAFVVENRLRSEDPDWPRKVAYLLTVVAVAFTILFVTQVLSTYSML